MLLTGRIQSERMGRWEGLPVGLNRPGSEDATVRQYLNKYKQLELQNLGPSWPGRSWFPCS